MIIEYPSLLRKFRTCWRVFAGAYQSVAAVGAVMAIGDRSSPGGVREIAPVQSASALGRVPPNLRMCSGQSEIEASDMTS
jgi:hypothetical protein